MKKIVFIILVAVTSSLWSCGDKKTETAAATKSEEQAEEHHEEGESNIVGLTPEQIKTVGVELGKIESKDLSNPIKVAGILDVPAKSKAFITTLASGVIRSIHVQPGSFVRRGQLIATVANTEQSGLQQQLISVNAQLRLAELDVERQRELVKGNAAPLKNLQRAEAEQSTLRAQRTALQQSLSALGLPTSVNSGSISSVLRITAPISGTISEVNAQIGAKVDASTPVAEVVNNSELHLDLFVYEKDLPHVREGQVIHFTLSNNPGKEYDAAIYAIGTAFTDDTKAISVHARIQGSKTGLIQGMSVSAIISTGSNTALAVPSDAVVSAGGKDYIFVRTDKKAEKHHEEEGHEEGHEEAGHKETESKDAEGHTEEHTINFERIEVAKGTANLGFIQITPVGEIPAGAQIVVKGAFFVNAKMTNTGGHEH